MRHTTTAALTAILIATLAGCGSNSDTTTEAKPSASPADSGTPSASDPSSKPPTPTEFKVGEQAKLTDEANSFTVQVSGYAQAVKGPTPPDTADDGDVWATVDAKICNTSGDSFMVSQAPWSLTYADGTVIEAFGATGLLSKPEFPMGFAVKKGRCARGVIPFLVPNSQRPERIVYAPDSLPEPYEWTAPAK
ncbi:DUF4352 domain-containing protein [Streptomyces sp. HNM0645]|uniref:DUF4352 domain-containing protein n=1 Tax=Streptomyces sp. HNM0645 TaxID=2782343 RepID=UPI0024B748AE|nr:DUF4352 domain-containing protein [Streptomyces sp. HNM0645]MDI9885919.1 DUF4352 domain-containing protein [Streptomyces sp. HNM0645]